MLLIAHLRLKLSYARSLGGDNRLAFVCHCLTFVRRQVSPTQAKRCLSAVRTSNVYTSGIPARGRAG